MHENPVYLSKEGLEKMREELRTLKSEKRREVSARIEKAKELGDLRENAEYHDAKDELAWVEGRIMELEDALNRAVVIEAKGSDVVSIGCRVKVTANGKEKAFTIVGSTEADPLQGRISNESPLGRAFLGKKLGEIAEVKAPSGTVRYTIAEISC